MFAIRFCNCARFVLLRQASFCFPEGERGVAERMWEMKKSRSWGKKLLSAAVSLVLAAGLLPVMPAKALAVAKDDA